MGAGSSKLNASTPCKSFSFLPPLGSHGSLLLVGFTLIEVVLVAVVMSFLLLASIPKFQQTAQRLRLEQTAFAVAQLLRHTHEQAIAEGHDMVLVWEQRARQIWSGPLTADARPPALGELARTSVVVSEGIALSLSRNGEPVDCQCVRFFLDGTSEPTTITLRSQEDSYTVTVDEATSRVILFQGAAAR